MNKISLAYTNIIRKACLGILENGHRGTWKEYPRHIEFECENCDCVAIIKQIKNDYKLIGDAHIIVCIKKP
jgi:hypothetical protein